MVLPHLRLDGSASRVRFQRRGSRLLVLMALTAAVFSVSLFNASAASAYWDYSGYLPKPGTGERAYVKLTNVAVGEVQPIRMTWSTPTDRNTIVSHSNGSWQTWNFYGPFYSYDVVHFIGSQYNDKSAVTIQTITLYRAGSTVEPPIHSREPSKDENREATGKG